MKKKSTLFFYNDELDLNSLLRVILNAKVKITIITLISFLIGLGYTYQLPNTYLNTLVIKPSDNSEFIKYSSFNRLLNSNRTFLTEQSDEKNTINRKILKRFINELEDYEEFVYTLKDTSKVRENFSKVLSEDQKKILFKYSQSLEIIKPKKDENNFILNLKWDSTDEAIVILQDTIILTLKNFEKLIFKELEDYLEIEKKIALNKDIKRINFLTLEI